MGAAPMGNRQKTTLIASIKKNGIILNVADSWKKQSNIKWKVK